MCYMLIKKLAYLFEPGKNHKLLNSNTRPKILHKAILNKIFYLAITHQWIPIMFLMCDSIQFNSFVQVKKNTFTALSI